MSAKAAAIHLVAADTKRHRIFSGVTLYLQEREDALLAQLYLLEYSCASKET